MSIVGATSAEGLSSLQRFTNIFTAIRTSFRHKRPADANTPPLGREVQHQNPTIRASQSNSTKGQAQVFRPATPVSLRSGTNQDVGRSGEGRPLGVGTSLGHVTFKWVCLLSGVCRCEDGEAMQGIPELRLRSFPDWRLN